MPELDLDEIDEAVRSSRLLGKGRGRIFSFREEDYVRYEGLSTKESIVRLCREKGVAAPIERVALLTNLRTMGRSFNPVSFYFCHDGDGALSCVVAEVTNTFRERKTYVLGAVDGDAVDESRTKYFYVSPFIDLDARFAFHLESPSEQLRVRIDGLEHGERMLITTATGRRQTLTDTRLAWYALRFPFISVRILTLIHVQALRLWAKGLPYHRKDSHVHLQREVTHATHH